MPIVSVKIKKINQKAILPTCGSPYAAGYDLYACINEPVKIFPHETIKIGTGLTMELPISFWLGIFARSGLATKQGLRPANCVGVIDSDYRGEIIVALHNDTDEIQTIYPQDRIGQAILMPRYVIDFKQVNELTDTERGAGGFGSTGK